LYRLPAVDEKQKPFYVFNST